MTNFPANLEPIRVVACPHPFRAEHEELWFAPSIALSQIFKEVQPDEFYRARAHIWVNDEYIPPSEWETTFPAAGSKIDIRVVPAGKVGKIIGSIFIAVAAIAVSVLTAGLGVFAAGGLLAGYGALAGGIAGMAVGILGTLVLNALIPPIPVGSSGMLSELSAMPGTMDYGATSPTLAITGASNRENLYGPVPKMLGRFRVCPPYGARTYTESVGADQYLRLLFIWGFPVQIEDLAIGQTPLHNFPETEIEHRNLTLLLKSQTIAIDAVEKTLTRASGSWLLDGVSVGCTLTLSGSTTVNNDASYFITEVSALVLKYSTVIEGAVTESGNGSQEASVVFGNDDLTLYSKTIHEEALQVLLEYETPVIRTSEIDAEELSVDVVCPNGLYDMDPVTGVMSSKEVVVKISYRLAGTDNEWIEIVTEEGYSGSTSTWVPVADPTPEEIYGTFVALFKTLTVPVRAPSGYYDVVNFTVPSKSLSLTGSSGSAVRKGYSWVVPKGQYEVRLERMTPPDTQYTGSVSYWVALRTIKIDSPINCPVPLAMTAMRIKASGRLNGVVDEFSAIATSICPDYNKNGIAEQYYQFASILDSDGFSISGIGGANYSPGDILEVVQSGASGGKLQVDEVGEDGEVTGVSILSPGSGYAVATGLETRASHAGGYGCRIDLLTIAGTVVIDEDHYEIATVEIADPGHAYQVNDVLTVLQSGASGGTLLVTSVGESGEVTGVSLITGGTGYSVINTCATTVAPEGGLGCVINVLTVLYVIDVYHLDIDTWQINSVNAGIKYSVGDILTVIQDGGSGKTFSVDEVDDDGKVTAATMLTPGSGYTQSNDVPTTVAHVLGSGCMIDILAVENSWVSRVTQNPASLYREVLQGDQCAKQLPDNRIILSKLEYWHDYCEANGWKYNKNIDYSSAIKTLAGEIAAAGRASFAWLDSKLTVIIDEPQPFIIGPAFTPRNILKDSFQSVISYPDMPHAFRVIFRNEEKEYQQDERLVLDDGYLIDGLDAWGVDRSSDPDYQEATIFEQLELPGVTDPELIFKHARYHIAAARLRAEVITFDTDFEWLVATRGDRIKFAHDVISVGLAYGRVTGLIYEGGFLFGEFFSSPFYDGDPSLSVIGVKLDEFLDMEEGKTYVLRFRLADNSSLITTIRTIDGGFLSSGFFSSPFYVGEMKVAIFDPPLAPGAPCPAIGDLFLFGESSVEAIDLIIKSIQPKSEFAAKITAVAYNPDIYEADTGIIPSFASGLSSLAAAGTPAVAYIRSGVSALLIGTDGSFTARILLTLTRPSALDANVIGVEAAFWPTGTNETPTVLPVVSLDDNEISLRPVDDGKSYDYQLRYVYKNGLRGWWTAAASHIVGGKTEAFQAEEQATPDMTVHLLPGIIRNGYTTITLDAQDTEVFVAPSANSRIDRVVVDAVDGLVSVVSGTEDPSPVPPAIPAGKLAVCQVAMETTTTAILNDMITDERSAILYG